MRIRFPVAIRTSLKLILVRAIFRILILHDVRLVSFPSKQKIPCSEYYYYAPKRIREPVIKDVLFAKN